MTRYMVFEKEPGAPVGQSGGGTWVERGEVDANSRNGAISAYLDKATENKEGTFAAVPSRSFQPVTVKPVTKLTFK